MQELAAILEATLKAEDPDSDEGMLVRKRLTEIRGFLNYVIRTYHWLNPYLKGLHNTIDGFRFDRDSGGLKLTGTQLQAMLASKFEAAGQCRREFDAEAGGDGVEIPPAVSEVETPKRVKPVERLSSDVKALLPSPPATLLPAQPIVPGKH